ncbi:MAG: EAL domain-containing protein [Chloroflexi bacterium]|nr:EAL domain-containing protein [Chloroflexota bacterium]
MARQSAARETPVVERRYRKQAEKALAQRGVTERKQAQDELKRERSEKAALLDRTSAERRIVLERDSTARNHVEVISARLSEAVESSSESVIIFDADGHPFYLNPSFAALFGYTLDALQTDGGWQSLYVDSTVAADSWATVVGGTSWQGDVELRGRDGRVIAILLRMDRIVDDAGQLIGMVGTCTDITAPKQAEQELRENRDFLQAVIDAVADPIFVKDEQHRWVLGNDAFWDLLGQPDGAVGKTDHDLFPKEEADVFWAEDERTLTGGTVRENEEALTGADGQTRTFLTKKTQLTLTHGSRYLVAVSRDVSERKQLEGQLSHLAYYDLLSGLPNRALFMDRLGQALARAPRLGRSVAVLYLDLDNFRVINDSLGHAVGDRLLASVAERLVSSVRPGDTAARFGGDEFAVLLEDIGNDAFAREAADRIVTSLRAPITLDTHEICPSFSIGVAVSTPGSETAEGMVRHADLAMYRAKANGKAQYVMFDQDMAIDAMNRMTMEAELRGAVPRNELRIDYQPIVDLETGRITEVEALVRWQHPQRGLVSPARFIPIAEETGLIVPIGQWVLEQACRQAQTWRADLPDAHDLVMSVNLSARQFRHPELVEDVSTILRETGLDPSALELEITESVVMEHVSGAITTMQELKALGIHLAIDDFGTGYSSLAYLKQFPIDTLKIDRSFVHGLGHDDSDLAIVRSVIALATGLQLTVTAEGIETAQQLGELQALGCDHGQGYFLARPAAEAAIRTLLTAEASSIEPYVHPTAVTATQPGQPYR